MIDARLDPPRRLENGRVILTARRQLAEPMSLDDLSAIGATDVISPYSQGGSLAWASNLYRGKSTEQIAIDEALRNLLFIDKGFIKIEDTSFMPGLDITD